MDQSILKQYGISFFKKEDGRISTSAHSKSLDIYLYLATMNRWGIEAFIKNVNLALDGQYNAIPEAFQDWTQELGYDLYIGEIMEDKTFVLYIDDYNEDTAEVFPLQDIKVIFMALLEIMGSV